MLKSHRLAPKPTRQCVIYSPSPALFSNEQEHYCFRLFCDKTALQLSGYFDSGLWSRLVLQSCETNSSIRHAVVAIGALHHTFDTARLLSSSGDRDPQMQHEQVQKHHHFALRQFGTALREMRDSTSGNEVDVRVTLLGCILVTCFETFHGNHQSAIAQIQSGLALMETWQPHTTEDGNDLSGTSSPLPFTVEDELYNAFGRLEIQMMSFADFRPKSTHDRMRLYGTSSVKSMPARFSDLKEARIYLEVIMRRLMHFRASISSSKDFTGALRIVSSVCPQNDAIASKRAHKEELRKWHEVFEPLWEYAQSPNGGKHIRAATTLEIHYLACNLTLDNIRLEPIDSLSFAEKTTPTCKAIVSLSRKLFKYYDTNNADIRFSFDLHVVMPLFITGLRCRHFGIRRQAIALLFSYPRRDGIWDSMMAAKTVSWIADIDEEDGLEGNAVPENTGVIDIRIEAFNIQARTVHVKCLQLKSGVKQPVERQTVITW